MRGTFLSSPLSLVASLPLAPWLPQTATMPEVISSITCTGQDSVAVRCCPLTIYLILNLHPYGTPLVRLQLYVEIFHQELDGPALQHIHQPQLINHPLTSMYSPTQHLKEYCKEHHHQGCGHKHLPEIPWKPLFI